MLNWVFLRKFLFGGTIVSLSTTPLFLIDKYATLSSEGHISEYKKNIQDMGNKYASDLNMQDLAKGIFRMEDFQDTIYDVFAQDVARVYLASSPYITHSRKFGELGRNEVNSFNSNLKDFRPITHGQGAEVEILDDNGGNRSHMRRRILGRDSFYYLKDQILSFTRDDFGLNTNKGNKWFMERHNSHLSKSELSEKENWEKVGFYYQERDDFAQGEEEFLSYKFEFLNWAFERWFEEVKPFYVWMSLWKYKATATTQEMESTYDKTKSNPLPKTPNYEFPLFSSKSRDGVLSSEEKFKKFYENVVKGNSNEDMYVPLGYTDDISTSIYVEGARMYSDLYVKFAAAANYKYYSKLRNNVENQNGQPKTREKTKETPDSIIGLFTEDGDTKFEKGLLKKHVEKEKITDVVDVKDTPWIFNRNEAGVHAIGIDGWNSIQNGNGNGNWFQSSFNHFKYRTLQAILAQKMGLKRTLSLDINKPIDQFKGYLSENFSRFFLKYAFEKMDDANNLFFKNLPSGVRDFKELFGKYDSWNTINRQFKAKANLRNALFKEYSNYPLGMTEKTNRNLLGKFPYKIEKEKEKEILDSLEGLYSQKLDGGNTSKQPQEAHKELHDEVGKYVEKLNLTLNYGDEHFLQSDRVFTNNFYINSIVDAFLNRPELLNAFLTRRELKSGFLGKSILGKGYVDTSDDTLFLKGNGAGSDNNGDNNDQGWYEDLNTNTQSGQIPNNKTFKNLQEYLQRFYYPTAFAKANPGLTWTDLIWFKIYDEDMCEKDMSSIKSESEKIFKDQYYLNYNNAREGHEKFLATLSYLLEDDFSNLRGLLSSALHARGDAYFLFDEFKDECKKLLPVLRAKKKQQENKQQQQQAPEQYFRGLLILDKPPSWARLNVQNSEQYRSKSLNRFGASFQDLISYVKGLDNEQDLDRLISTMRSIKDNTDIFNTLESKVFEVKGTNNQPNTRRTLTLNERKNLFVAYLSNKEDITLESGTRDTMSKENYKKIFKVDPDDNFNPIEGNQSQDNSSDSEKHFKKNDYFKADDEKLIRIQPGDLSTKESFKNFLNKKLTAEIFFRWLIDIALSPDVQDMAMGSLWRSATGMRWLDRRFKEAARADFVNN